MNLLSFILLLGLLITCIVPMGNYMARVYSNQFVLLESLLGPVEDNLYRLLRIDPNKEMTWQQYAIAVVVSSLGGFLFLFTILKYQAYLPLNPSHFPNLSNDLAFNIAISFISNTDWQSYSGESTLSYFSQMVGLTVQNFLSAGMGMAVAIAFIRGISRRNTKWIGNYWVDWTRGVLYILLPLSLAFAVFLGSQGVIQNFDPIQSVPFIEKSQIGKQIIPGGPVASQIAIKLTGSNGGGFFNANSAHPFENPTSFSNFIGLFAILLTPLSFYVTFGVMINNKKEGWTLFLATLFIFIPLFVFGLQQEEKENSLFSSSLNQSAGNMEGKEVRLGTFSSVLWASATTATSNGTTNSQHDSYTPLGGLVPLLFLLLGEVVFGGVGCGLYGILIFMFVAVFIAGLMVGRTPEYLGKKIQPFEIKMSAITLFVSVFTLLVGTALSLMFNQDHSMTNIGPQGFTEILYAFASASGNNGSAFAGLNANTPFYNTLLGIIMWLSRYWMIVPILAIAGSLAEKNSLSETQATLSTRSLLFVFFLIGMILIISLLTYIPSLTLGPISEYFHTIK